MIRLVIADDHAIVRSGVRELLAAALDMQVVGEAASAAELETLVERGSVDVVITDMSMPGGGIDLIRRLRTNWPGVRLLVLSMHNEGAVVAKAVKAGAAGYVSKDSEPGILVAGIRRVAGGGNFIDPALVEQVVFDGADDSATAHKNLSNREFQVLRLLVQGVAVVEIADSLNLSAKTISTHKARLMQKLGIDNNAELVRYALRQGILSE